MKLSPAQVAKQLEVGLPYVYTLLQSGKLLGERIDGRWRIAQETVDSWKAHVASRKRSSTSATTSCD